MQWKNVEIIEVEMAIDHAHILVMIPPHKISVSGFMGYLKGKSSLMIYQKWGNMKFQYRCREFWCRRYFIDTTNKKTEVIKKYREKQLKMDKEAVQIFIQYCRQPLKLITCDLNAYFHYIKRLEMCFQIFVYFFGQLFFYIV